MTLYSPRGWFLYEDGGVEERIESIQAEIDAIGSDLAANSRAVDTNRLRLGATHPLVLLRPVAGGHQFDHQGPVLTMELSWEQIGDGSEWDHVDCVALAYEATNSQYTFGMVSYQYEALGIETPDPISADELAKGRIDHPTWLMIFPPKMVEEYGREWLLDLPAERIEELEDGAILICATDRPNGDEGQDAWEEKFTKPMETLEDAFGQRDS